MKAAERMAFVVLVCPLAAAWGQTQYFIGTIAGSDAIDDNGPATQALLATPTSVAVDANGNLYIADTGNHRIRKVTPGGTIATIACSGKVGYSGDSGPATQAACSGPRGVAVDAAGNVYFSDTGNNYVRKVGPDGKISVAAGNGNSYPGGLGDGGPATQAYLSRPAGLAVDSFGDLYIADSYNQRIRRVTPDGLINTVAGAGYCSSSGDNELATQAALCYPQAVAVDPLGRVLVADTQYSRIRRFIPGGLITTVAGNGSGFSGDGGPAISAQLNQPGGVAVDASGLIYVSDSGNQRIRAIAVDGTISTIAGSVAGFGGDSTAATNALFTNPQGIALDNRGNLYIADSGNDRVRMISALQIVTTVAGFGHYAGDNGPAVSAVMTNPSFVTMDSLGNLYVSDQDDHVIRKINAAGIITTIAGTGVSGNLGDGGPATSAELASPEGLAFDSMGNLYVADAVNNNVRMITPAGTIAKIAGDGTGLGDGGPAQTATFNSPHGIAVDGKGNIYIADSQNNRVRQITPDGMIDTFLGNGAFSDIGDGGLATAAGVAQPWDVKVAGDGTVYIAENNGNRVRAVSPAGIVSTIGNVYSGPSGIALTSAGNIFVSTSNEIWSLSPSGSATAIAGGSSVGFGGDGGPALQALLNGPVGLVTDANGNIYFCDQKNNRVRKLSPDTLSQVTAVSGDRQTAEVGTVLPLPLVIQVNGSLGDPFPGVKVTYAIASGSGKLSVNQTVTGPDGRAGVTLTLPPAPGIVTVTATVAGLPAVTFTATAVDIPSSISVLSGNNQSGVAGSTLPQILAVSVMGIDGKPAVGVLVTFAVTSGSGSLTSAMQTASDGSAWALLTLGAAAGPITVSATVAGLPPAIFSATAMPVNGPQISPGGVVSAGLSTPPLQITAPNAIVSIFGRNFAPAGTLRSVMAGDLVNGMVPTNLAGVCVLFGTLRAPIFLVAPGQLNVQVPQVPAPGTPAVQVIANCDAPSQTASSAVTVAVAPASPEFFYAANDGSGKNPVAAADSQTGSAIGDSARLGAGFAASYPGESITIYATGLGLTTPAFAAGQLPPGEAPVSNVAVSIDGVALDPSQVQYAGLAPLNAGLYQLNIILPAYLTNGDHAITMSVSGRTSPADAFITVGDPPQ